MSLREWQEQVGTLLLKPAQVSLVGRGADPNASALALYEELLFNTVCGTVENIYPFTHQVLTHHQAEENQWRGLVEAYRRACPNRSYSLIGAICDFSQFLGKQPTLMAEFPFLADLAHYEWLEMAVLNDLEPALPEGLASMVPNAALFDQYQPVWNPLRRLYTFSYNIPGLLDTWKASPQSVLENPERFSTPQDLLIYRDPRTLDARFFVVNELTATLLRQSGKGASYEATLVALQSEIPALGQLPGAVLKRQAQGLFEDCLGKGILMGSLSGSV